MGIKLEPTTVVGGNNAAFAVYLNGPAGPGGTVVTLTSSSSNATSPATVTIPQGATDANAPFDGTAMPGPNQGGGQEKEQRQNRKNPPAGGKDNH